MKSFDEWIRQPILTAKSAQEVEEDLAEEKGLSGCFGHWSAKCSQCDRWYEITVGPEEFDPDFTYCGRSEYCCP